MRVRVPYDTTQPDWPVNLPTWVLVELDPATGTATVDVPEADVPEDIVRVLIAHADPKSPIHLPPVVRRAMHAAWHEHLDNRYKEHHGRFRPEIV